MSEDFETVAAEVRACRVCLKTPRGKPLPHEPRPVLRGSAAARILIVGQAPGTRVHASGQPFTDPSGDRLRNWLGIDEATFYDERVVAIVPMGFCFPGLDAKGGDLPPRKECAPLWRDRVLATMPKVELVVAVGMYALKWHLGKACGANLAETLGNWRAYLSRTPPLVALPHPSWRNNALLKRHPHIEAEMLPELRRRVRDILQNDSSGQSSR